MNYVKAFESYCITACECMHHMTKMAVTPLDPPYPKHANLTALSFIEPKFTLRK